jgi:hypothetical protein
MMKIGHVFLLLVLSACSSGPVPRSVIQPEKMQKIVHDLIQVDEFINNFIVKDTTVDIKKKRSVLYNQVFKINNTDRKEFYSSYKYYQQHPDIQKALYDSLYQTLNRKAIEVDSTKAKVVK